MSISLDKKAKLYFCFNNTISYLKLDFSLTIFNAFVDVSLSTIDVLVEN